MVTDLISDSVANQSTKPSTLADDVFDQIRNAIVKGELAPGSKINEPQLSRQYGISRGPLREAIRRLEGCKLVEIKPNVGANIIYLSISQITVSYTHLTLPTNREV